MTNVSMIDSGLHLPKLLQDNRGGTLRNIINSGSALVETLLPKSLAAGIDPTYQSMINQQMELQRQMLLVSMHSNVEKTKHEIQMAPIRNIRVG